MALTLFEKDNVMYSDYAQPLDTITALPGQVTTIRATFDKPGRYVWHCHVLSHEDHQMMRVFHVGDYLSDGKLPEGVDDDFDNNSIPDGLKESEDIPSSLWKLLLTLVLSILSTILSLWAVYRLVYDANGIIINQRVLRYDAVPTKASSVTSGTCDDTSQEDNDEILVQSGHNDENEYYMEEGALRID
jgi:Multicopper oxidase